MSWLVEQKRSWPEWAVIRLLRVGPLPRHVAIIMDGNRRFAKRIQKETLDGHVEGFNKLTHVLCWCRDLGIAEVTVYTFSIANFNRSKQEVTGLMNLASEKFSILLNEKDKLAAHGVCIRIIGNLDMLPEKIRQKAAEAVIATRHNNKCYLNLAFAYTSQEEISTACNELKEGVKGGKLQSSDITEELLERCLYTSDTRDPDLLIRTSGEVRLSDFMLWQSGFSCIFFTKVLWPEITIWHLFAAIFYYQRHYHTLTKAKQESLALRQREGEEMDLECCRAKYGEKVSQEHLCAYTASRENRTSAFLSHLHHKRLRHLQFIASQ